MPTNSPDGIMIEPARGEKDLGDVAALFREYQTWLDAPVCFRDFDDELNSLAEIYAPPRGELWLARSGDEVIGVVGMKPRAVETGVPSCELKRLYVRDSWRGRGVGRCMANACVNWARETGYVSIGLETLGRLGEARALYRSLGFTEPADVADNILETPIFMALDL